MEAAVVPAGGLAVYMRVSSDEQKQQGTIENQRAAADRYLAVHGVTPHGWYADDGVSGTIPFAQRPEGARLLADAAAGYVTTLVCWRLDRMGRNALAVLQAVESLERAGVRIVSITESFDTSTPAGRLQVNMLATIAQFERESMVQRVEQGNARRLEGTTWMGGRANIGYRVEGKKRDARLVLNDIIDEGSGYSEVDVIRLGWHLLVEQDWPCERIAAHLDTLNIPTRDRERTSHGWAPGTVYRMLSNPILAGVRTYRAKDGTLHSHPVPAILSAEQVERLQQALRDHKRSASVRKDTDPYLLRGLMRYGLCGEPYTTSRSRLTFGPRAGELWRCYRCMTRYFRTQFSRRRRVAEGKVPAECLATSVDARNAEADIWADIEAFTRDPAQVLRALAAKQQATIARQADDRAQLAKVQQDLDELQGQRDEILALYRRGRISERDLDRQLDQIAAEEAGHTRTRDELLAALGDASDASAQLETARTVLLQLRARLDVETLTPALKRDVIRALVREIRVETQEIGLTTRGRIKRRAVLHVWYCFDEPAEGAHTLRVSSSARRLRYGVRRAPTVRR
jgi:site-specific DNA recombinase